MATTQTRRDERLLIGGEWVEATGSGRFDVTNPANGEVVGSTPDATADDVRAAINAAADALDGWRNTTRPGARAAAAQVGRRDARARSTRSAR